MSNRVTLKQGKEEARLKTLLSNGEPMFCTDSLQIYIGDGVTLGGRPIRAVDIPYLRSAFSFRFNEYVEVSSVFQALDLIYKFTGNLDYNIYYGDVQSLTLPMSTPDIISMFSSFDMIQEGPIGPKDLSYSSNFTHRVIAYPKAYGVLAAIQDPALNYMDIRNSYTALPVTVAYQGTAFYIYTTLEPLLNDVPKSIRYLFAYGSGTVVTGGATSIPTDPSVRAIHQEDHGFVVGNWLVRSTGIYEKASARTELLADIVGVVVRVIGPDDFILQMFGFVSGLSDLADGYTYFLSATIDGAIQTTPPTEVGAVNKPVFIADSETSGFIINYRGIVNNGSI